MLEQKDKKIECKESSEKSRIANSLIELWESALNTPDITRKESKRHLRDCQSLNFKKGIALAKRNIGYTHAINTEVEPSMSNLLQSAQLFDELDMLDEKASVLDILCNMYAAFGDFEKAFSLAFECQTINKKIGNKRGLAWAYQNVALISIETADLDQAMHYAIKAIKLFLKIKHANGIISSYYRAGIIYKSKDPQKAIRVQKKAYEIALANDNNYLMAQVLDELAVLYHLIRQYDNAKKHFYLCLQILDSSEKSVIRAKILIHLASLYLDMNELEKATEELKKCHQLINNQGLHLLEIAMLKVLSELHAKQNNYKKAYQEQMEVRALHSKIFNEELKKKTQNMQIALRVEHAEREAHAQKLRYEEKAKAEKILAQTLEDIDKDLDLAQKVQSNLISKSYKNITSIDIAVYFKPMIKIGGDIYDIHETSNGKIRIFLADATGHGIQAALSTIIIKTEYDKLKNLDLTLSQVLELLNERFCTNYKDLQNYFTCVIAEINSDSKSIKLVSAGHPAQIYTTTKKVHSVKPSGALIGVFAQSKYEELQFTLTSSGYLCLFTDGFVETRSPSQSMLGEEGLYQIILKAPKNNSEMMLADVVQKIFQFEGDADIEDDKAMIICKIL